MKTMKNFALSSLTSAALVFCGSALAADGTITITGKVTDRTCTITGNGGTSQSFALPLPTVSFSSLNSEGKTTARTPFYIELTNCTAGSTVATYFEPGPSVDFKSGRLLNQSTGNSAATNVQVQLLGSNGQFLPILAVGSNGAQTNSQWVAVDSTGAASLHYYSEYYATGVSTAGNVTTNVQYTIIYQ
ncbi:type 1 fimbrial protein [Xylella taiwanensis]|uniref:Ferrous iron transporter B n=2 Tax=Xylella taiwanensis TaxID=1444770 RepID=Z9JGZ4_9GAMM|nr:ferrous iron transporter B [Xylella taiwanensis]NBI36953.1 type 1 fimbrial protein [Xylella taiwanensis]QKD97546.1 type 1 fimbrial protein [Xylella taiwanensis]